MELDLTYFDLEKILNEKPILLATSSLQTIDSCCKAVQGHKLFFGITGEPGFGKSASFEQYKKSHENVYYITIEKSMNSRGLYFDLAFQLGIKAIDFNKVQLNALIRSVSYALNNSSNSNLIILDEAGKFNATRLLYLHELRDATKATTGIIVAGPTYFRNNLETWSINQREGIPELCRRIQSWVNIDPPTKEEKTIFCKERGIKDPYLIKEFVKESISYGDLDNRIIQAKMFVLQELYLRKQTVA